MEYASVTVQLETQDIVAFSRFVAEEHGRKWKIEYLWGLAIGGFVAFFLLLIPFWVTIHRDGHSVGEVAAFFLLQAWQGALNHSFILSIALIVFSNLLGKRLLAHRQLRSKRFWQARRPSLFLSNLYQVLDEGFCVENDRVLLLTRWTAIARVAETADYVYVMETGVHGQILPKRCFSTPEAAADFAAQVRLKVEKYAAAPSVGAQAALVINAVSA